MGKGVRRMLKHVTMQEAISLTLEQPVSRRMEDVPLSDALGRVLAEDVHAQTDLPPFNKSPFDGYAYRTADAPGTLRVVGVHTAGVQRLTELHPGEAVQIFTGAPVPESADAVVKQENVTRAGDEITVSAPANPGTNVILRGEDVRCGALLIPGGTRLLPAHLGELAGQGIANVRVWRRPKAVLLPTGSELAEPGEVCQRYGIYNSSSIVLTSYLTRMGIDVRRGAIVPDEEEATYQAVRAALESDADVVFTTGGASVGDFDFAVRTAQRMGAETLFWKVRMKPGGALIVSRVGEKLLVGLSGNPAAAVMSLLVVLRPWLMKLTGAIDRACWLTLPLEADMPKTSRAVRLLRGKLSFDGGNVWFSEQAGRGNRNLASFAGCEFIGVVPGGGEPLARGDMIQALRLPPELC